MKVNIPKRFESKTAIREFIQSREFIVAMKQSMTSQLFICINNCNRILKLINAKREKQLRMHGGGILQPKDPLLSQNPLAVMSQREFGQSNGHTLTSPPKKVNDPQKFKRKKSLFNGETNQM